MESRAVLAEIWLAQSDLAAAQNEVEHIVAHLNRGGNFEGTEYRLRNRLVCFQVLHALRDQRAANILQTAYKRLQDQAKQIEAPEMKEAFLSNVPWHKEIITAWEQMGSPK